MQPQEVPDSATPGTPTIPGLILPEATDTTPEPPKPAVEEVAKPITPTASTPEADEAETTVPELAPEDPTEVAPAADPFSWQASEYIHHAKGAGWYLILGIVVAILVAGVALTKQWFAIPVFVAMFAAVVVYARKAPRTLTYTLDEHGITIESKPYPFKQFRSFSISRDVAWHSIDLEPTQRFSPRQTILFDEKDLAQITEHLSAQLPREDRQPDAIERAARYLRF